MLMARVIEVFGASHPYHAYLFARLYQCVFPGHLSFFSRDRVHTDTSIGILRADRQLFHANIYVFECVLPIQLD